MPSLIGNKPNQVPTNGDLGKLAFMDIVDTISNNPYYDTAISDVQPTLNLDFANAKTLDSRITFARATTATFYDAKSSAKAEENLLRFSEQLDNAVWGKSVGATVTANSAVAPDGTTTADTINFTADELSRVQQGITAGNLEFTYSVWLKVDTGTVSIRFGEAGTLNVITVTTTWQRFTFSFVTINPNFTLRNAVAGTALSFYAWGAQLEQRSSVTAYTPTTANPITNYIPTLQTAPINTARLDYNPVTRLPNGLLIEENRSNLVLYSSEFDNVAWTKNRSSITANTIVAPDGTLTGDKLVEDTANNTHLLFPNTAITVVSAAPYSYSVYLKAGERTIAQVADNDLVGATFDLSNGTITNLGTGVTASINSVGNGWYRCVTTRNAPSAIGRLVVLLVSTGTTTSYTGNGFSGIYIWGAQLEAGSFPTSYIPTVASQVTRSADSASMTGTNFSSWYNISEGTFMYNATVLVGGSSAQPNYVVGLGNATNNDKFSNMGTYELRRNYLCPSLNEISQTYLQKQLVSAFAFSTTQNLVSAALSGVLLNNNSALTSFVTNGISEYGILGIGNSGRLVTATPSTMTIKKIQYYPVRLSNAELSEMTS